MSNQFQRIALTGCLAAVLIVGTGDAPAAESFDCGAGGKGNSATAKCDCPAGKVEVTIGKVSRCVAPTPKPVNTAAPVKTVVAPPTGTCPPGEHSSEGHCCGDGEEWFPKAGKCTCVDEPACKKAKANPKPVATATTVVAAPLTCPGDMVLLKGGKYWVGSNEVKGALPPKQVQLADYCLDKTEVTVADYAACVQSGACSPAATTVSWTGIDESVKKFWSGFCNAGKDDKKDHPINCVDWTQAEAFCSTFGKRLPSEEEWELAARGPEGRPYAWGTGEPSADKACWKRFDFDKLKGEGTCAVNSLAGGNTANGLVAMTGNVWEWTSTKNGADFVDRGGGWSNDDKSQLATTFRATNPPSRRGSNVGFRCAR